MAAVDICRDDPLLLPAALLFERSQLRQQIENRLELEQIDAKNALTIAFRKKW